MSTPLQTSDVSRFDGSFLNAVDLCLDLASRREVEDAWGKPSVLPKVSVGALACHLTRQILQAEDLLAQGTTEPTITAMEHFERLGSVTDTGKSVEGALDDEEAARGFVLSVTRGLAAHNTVHQRLADGGVAPAVFLSEHGWALTRDQFLLTRLVEIVVHSDDLAASVDMEDVDFPADVFDPVHGLLVALSLRRHGRHASLRALARNQRAGNVAIF